MAADEMPQARCLACQEPIDLTAGFARGMTEHARVFHPDDFAGPDEDAPESVCAACGDSFGEDEPYGMRVRDLGDGYALAEPVCLGCEALGR